MFKKVLNKFTNTILPVIVLGLYSLALMASEKVDKTLDVDADSLVEIEHVNGEAEIKGWDKNQIRVFGELGERTKEFKFERKGKTVVIEVEVEKHENGWGWNSNSSEDDLTIYVPLSSRVNYRSMNAELNISQVYGSTDVDMINGELNARNLEGSVRLKTVNGEIYATNIKGELILDSVNGDINVEHVSGVEIFLNTVNGDIEGNSNAQEVKATTVNGEIELILQEVKDLKTSTVNGQIEISMSLIEGGTVQASSVSGSVELAFQKDVQAKFSIETHAGGKIKNNLTADAPNKAKYGPRRWLEFSTSNPSAWVDISTVSGKVEITDRGDK